MSDRTVLAPPARGPVSGWSPEEEGSYMTQGPGSYLLAGQPTELERLQLQSRVREAAGGALLAQLPDGA